MVKRILHRVLCFFGRHDWDMVFPDADNPDPYQALTWRIECTRCKKHKEGNW